MEKIVNYENKCDLTKVGINEPVIAKKSPFRSGSSGFVDLYQRKSQYRKNYFLLDMSLKINIRLEMDWSVKMTVHQHFWNHQFSEINIMSSGIIR